MTAARIHGCGGLGDVRIDDVPVPVVDRTATLAGLHAALDHVASGRAHGKVLVRIDPEAFKD